MTERLPAALADAPQPSPGAGNVAVPRPQPEQRPAPAVERWLRGEAAAFGELISEHEVRVRRLAARLLGWRGDVEDVVQEVFVTVLLKSRSFRGDAEFGTWLAAVTLNQCRRHLRRERVRRLFLGAARAQASTSGRSTRGAAGDARPARVASDAVNRETLDHVRAAIAVLAVRDREVLVLRYLEQMQPGEIARLLGISPGTLDVRLSRARKRLKAAVRDFIEVD